MLKTTERLSLILTMNKYCLDLDLLKEFDAAPLLCLCNSLEARKIPHPWYAGCPSIQKELIRDEQFFIFLPRLAATKMQAKIIDSFLKNLHDCGETALDYPFGRLVSSMSVTAYHSEVFYDYLRLFSHLPTDKEQKKLIVKHLRLYQNQDTIPVVELPEAERALFIEPFLSKTRLIPDNAINQVFTMLSRQPELLELIRFFYENKLDIEPNIGHYESFSLAPGPILSKLKTLFRLLGKNDYNMRKLLSLWMKNNCSLFDLEVLSEKLKDMDAERLEDVFDTRSSYIGLIYGGKINNIPLTEVGAHHEDILIYAITNKKRSFLRLVEENFETFYSFGHQAILLERDFYARYVNLNSLSAKNLMECKDMLIRNMAFDALDRNRAYTFEEIKALYGQPVQYVKLYNRLSIPRIDRRLIALRQLTKQKLLSEVFDETHLDRLADKLSQKPLSAWREQDFAHIAGLKPQDAVELLIYQTEIQKFIPQMSTRTDARLALRNRDSIQNYDTIDAMKGAIERIDSAWMKLIYKMKFCEQFLRQNQERVIEFLCQNGAYIANTYYDNLSGEGQRESLKRILKAELMGEFGKLKYFADDLRKEIDYPISDAQKSVWVENTELTRGNITIRECDDFYSTMLLGTVPHRTCLSYIDGQYKECLLASFDSNKKVLYAYVNGKPAGRAIIRLTKGRFKGGEKKSEEITSLSFVDLESLSAAAAAPDHSTEKERLTLFLEKTYSAGISPDVEARVMSMFAELMERKATQMGAMLVLSNLYGTCPRPGYTRTYFYVYISKSKAGAQYLDSLNGSASVSDEGGYRSNNFFIRKDDII